MYSSHAYCRPSAALPRWRIYLTSSLLPVDEVKYTRCDRPCNEYEPAWCGIDDPAHSTIARMDRTNTDATIAALPMASSPTPGVQLTRRAQG
eukprot:scaffold151822_cov33-Tisochrysis_lutea.AAC.2